MALSLSVFLLSGAILAFELLLGRLLAVALWHHVTYMVVTAALLLFGLAGSVLALAPRLGGRSEAGRDRAFSVCSALCGAGMIASLWIVARADIDTIELFGPGGLQRLGELFSIYLLAGLPIFFGGLAVVISFRHQGDGIARVYFANLLGSALGCFAFVWLLEPLTGPGLLLLCGLLSGVAGIVAAGRGGVFARALGAVVAIAALGIGLSNEFSDKPPLPLPTIDPVESKVMSEWLDRKGAEIEVTRWNPICRVDVIKNDEQKHRDVFQDGDAPTYIYAGDDPIATARPEIQTPYLLRPDPQSLLVIGVGGGRELMLAHQKKVPRIVGVEINSSTTQLLREDYFDFTGGLVQKEGIELVNTDGRAYLVRSDERFDVIQMTGVDTYAALNSGAYVLSESYLYTQEAFDGYLDHLSDRGMLAIYRFYFEPPRETLRLFVMADRALRARGVEDPSQHMLVVAVGAWAALVVSLPPLADEEIERAVTTVRAMQGAENSALKIVFRPGEDSGSQFDRYMSAANDDKAEDFLKEYLYKVEPVRDTSPFFYHYHRWDKVWEALQNLGNPDKWRLNTGLFPTGLLVLLGLLVGSTVVALLLILGPLLFLPRGAGSSGGLRAALYFSALGTGYMLVEIGLAQRFALVLGHPTYSLSVVLAGMLAFSGLGSLVSGRLRPETAMRLALPLIVVAIAALAWFLPSLSEAGMQGTFSERVLFVLMVIAPVGFLMGMPMPSGLRILDRSSPRRVPWAWGANGVASVVASVLVILLAMEIGFEGVLLVALAAYALAFLSRPATGLPEGQGL